MDPNLRSLAGFPPEVARAIAAAIARHARPPEARKGEPADRDVPAPVAAFDWDNTCILNDVGDAALDHVLETLDLRLADEALASLLPERLDGLERRAPIMEALRRARGGDAGAAAEFRAESLALYDALGNSRGAAVRYRWAAAMLAGRTEPEVEELGEAVIDRGLGEAIGSERLERAHGRPPVVIPRGLRVYPPMARLARTLLESGFDLRIVTASAEGLVRAFARRIGIGAERVHGVRLAPDPETGRLLPQTVDPFTYAEGKIEALVRFAGRMPKVVAGDSFGDLPMLRASEDLRIVVERTPGAKAAQVARACGWLVVSALELLGVD